MDYEANGTEGTTGSAGFSLPEGSAAAIPLAAAAAAGNAIPLTPAADNTLVLPAGVTLDNITVQGRDLIIKAADGQTYVVHDGAVFVPTLVVDGVSVPPMNLAALLVGTEVQPAAGPVQSSGNNFEEAVGDIQDSFQLGDLLDYSEQSSATAAEQEVIPFADFEATAGIVNRNSALGTLAATDTVSEAGLPAREGEPAGSAPSAATTTVTGTLVFSAPDGLQSITVNGVVVTGTGQTIAGEHGTLTITSFTGGELGYSYVLGDNALTATAAEPFVFVVTDLDGDTATATLTVDIVDDVPVARNDSDALAAGSFGPELGNVITGTGTTGGAAGADTQGADGASVTRIASVNVAANVDTTFDGSNILTVNGQYGTLSINAGGTYSYVRNAGTPGGVADVFDYTLTDGDGDTSSATLTINLGDAAPTAAIAATGNQASANATASVSEAGLPPHGGLPAGSAEIADGNPNNNSNTGETTTGTIQFTAIDGLQGVTINGTLVTGVGQTIATPKGLLTITSASATSYGYSYSLTTNTSGDATSDVLTVAITDGDGDVATATLTINIADDVPTARADTDVVAAGTYGPETGNVITGTGATSGAAGADTQGADGAAISGVASNNVPDNSDTTFEAGTLVVAGQYGTLSIQANGDYSYVRTPGTSGGVSDVFTYTLTDGDGDVRTATLTIDITDSATSLIVITPENGEGEGGAGSVNAFTTVREGGLPPHGLLPAGSDEAADGNPDNNSVASETTTGSIVYTAPDGPAAVTINGVAVSAVAQTFVTPKGVLTITSIAPGSIGYSYSLTVNTNGENTHDDFAIGVTDIDGDHSDATLTINIVDDMPIARGDTDFVAAGKFTAETGNVITGAGTTSGAAGSDTLGADGAGISGIASVNVAGNAATTFNGSGNLVVAGQYGTLSIKADGSYSYVRASATPGGVTDTFTYTLTDGDGDPVTANLAIAIGNSTPTLTNLTPEGPEGTGGDVVVNEDDLPNGSDTSKESLTQTGTFTVTSPDGIQTLSIDGHTVVANGVFTVGSWATSGLGNTLSVISFANGVLTYSYTLNAAETHANAGGTNSLYESLAVVLTDLDGQAVSGALVARVVDDVAAARADTDALAVGVFTPETGNVITGTGTTSGAAGADTPGADGATITRVASVNVPANSDTTFESGNLVVAGQHGVLTIKANGDYSYVRNPGSAGGVSDQFSYTLTDADGDASTATLTISIADGTPTFLNLTPKGSGGDVSVDEDDLPAGSDTLKEALTQVGNFTVNSPDGVQTLSIGGHDVVSGGVFTAQSWTTPLGNTISVTGFTGGVLTYGYTLNAAATHPNANGENALFEDFAVSVTDNDGDTVGTTLSARIVDDVPLGANDVDVIAVGTTGPATGNVLWGEEVIVSEDANATDGVADTQGADGARVSAIDNAQDGAPAVAVPVNLGATIAGLYGTLKITANGDYSYTRTQGLGGGSSEVFTYTLTDGDGDTSTATLTIQIEDALPTAGTTTATLDDDALAGGIAGGTGDDSLTDTSNTSGFLVGTGGDVVAGGTLSFAFLTTGAPAGFTYETAPNGTDLLIKQNDTLVITVTLNPAGGAYTITQNAPILHATGSDENNQVFTLGYTAGDQDGDKAPGSLIINVDDDTPTAVLGGKREGEGQELPYVALQVDESDLGYNDTKSFAGLFQTAYGADGAGSTVYTLGVDTGSPTGLFDTATNLEVVLSVTGGVVEGRAGAGGPVVFLLSVDAATGEVTLDQVRAVKHYDPSYHDETVYLADSDLISLTVTVTDKDGDPASATAYIGYALSFRDDGPSLTASTEQPILVVDETTLGTATAASFTAIFTPTYGADGAGSVGNYVLGLNAGATGIFDVQTGEQVTLSINGGVVEGRIASGNALVFTVGVDASTGQVTLTQARAVKHSDTSNHDDSVTLADNLVTLTATVTDKDGDTNTATAQIGANLVFKDDGPSLVVSVEQPTLTVDESNFANNASTSFAGVFTPIYGNDGAGSVGGYKLGVVAGSSGLIDVATGEAVVLSLNGTVVEGKTATGGLVVFTVSVASNGTVTLDQSGAVQHPNQSNPNDSVTLSADDLVTLTATVTDKDGDTNTATANIGQHLVFNDDGPTLSISTQVNPAITIDESDLTANATVSFVNVFVPNYGNDGAGSVGGYKLAVTGTASGLVDVATNEAVNLSITAAGVVQGKTATTGQLVFNLSVDAATGEVTLDQVRAVKHPNTANPDDVVSLASDNLITLTATVTDKDGDTNTATTGLGLNLQFKDDGPSITGTQATVFLDDENAASTYAAPNAGGTDDLGAPVAATGTLIHSFGADGAGAVTLTGAGNPPYIGAPGGAYGSFRDAVAADGSKVEIYQYQEQGAVKVLTVTVTNPATGAYSVVQNNPIDHPTPQVSEESVTFDVTYKVTDKDGDSATGTLPVNVDDDTPWATADTGTVTEATGNYNVAFVVDFSGSISDSQLNTALDAVRAAGQEIFANTGGLVSIRIVGFASTAADFGVYTDSASFTLAINALNPQEVGGDRPNGIGEGTDYTAAIEKLLDVYTASSTHNNQVFVLSDGQPTEQTGPGGHALETATANAWNTFVDANGVTVTAIGIGSGIDNNTLDDIDVDGSSTPILLSNFDELIDTLITQVSAATISGDLDANDSYGADGGRFVSITVPKAGPDVTYTWNGKTGVQSQITVSGGSPINGQTSLSTQTELGGTFTIDFTTGKWTYTPPGSVAATTNEVFGYSIVDGDGDPVSSTLTITVKNDPAPSTTPVAAVLDDEGLTGGIAGGTGDNAGTPPEHIVSGGLGITFGTDGQGQVNFAGMHNQTATVGTETVRYAWNPSTDTLTAVIDSGSRSGTQLFKVVTTDSGSYTVTLLDNVLHATGANENDAGPVALTYYVSDGTGTATTGVLNLTFDDDMPTVTLSGAAAPSLVVDETSLNDDTTVSYASMFTTAFGADGAANSGSTAYALGISASGAATGLIDQATGQAIVLRLNNGEVQGRVGSTNGSIAFTVNVNSSGQVTLEQDRAIKHADTTNPDDSTTLSAANLVTLTLTAKDADGDTASQTANIGQTLKFEDDGPGVAVSNTPTSVTEGQQASGTWSADSGADATGAVTKVVVGGNEYNLNSNIATGLGTLRVNSNGTWTFTAANNANNNPANPTVTFTVKVTDGDGDAAQDSQTIAITDGTNPDATSNASITVDEEGLGSANATGTNSGANSENDSDTVGFTAGSDNITAIAFAADISGLTTNVNGIAGADIVWTRDSGTLITGKINGITAITITLTPPSLPITAGNSGSATVSVVLSDNFPHPNAGGENTINLSGLTVVATDTDGDSDAASVTISVKDDVPTLSVSNSPTGVTEGQTAAGTWSQNPGADSAGAVTKVVVGATEYNLDTDIVLSTGTLRVNSAGTWTFAANGNQNHSGASPSVSFTVRITDGDGDVASDSQTVTINDGANAAVTKTAMVLVDEEGLGNANATGTNAIATSEQNSDTVSFTAGSDNITAIAFAANISGLTTDFVGNSAADISWTRNSGTLITGRIGGIDVITITLTPPSLPITAGNSASATVTVTLLDNFPHPSANGENSISLTGLNVVATDSDGDPASAAVTITVKDDIPTVDIANAPNSVVEGQSVDGTWTRTVGADGSTTKVVVGANEYNLDTNISTGSGTLIVRANGTWTFTANGNQNNPSGSTVSFSVKLTDGDGDVVQDSLTITMTDGALPSVTKAATVNVDEEGLGNANATGSNSAATTETHSDTVTFAAGSDNITGVAFAANISGLTADVNGIAGADIVWTRNSGTLITGKIGAVDAITITLTPPSLPITAGNSGSATVSVTLLDNFPHPDGAGENSVALTGLTVVATDTDGDTAAAAVTINVKDDAPVAAADTATQAIEGQAFTVNALSNDKFGADGVDTANAAKVVVSAQAAHGTVTYNTGTGLFTYTPASGSTATSDSFQYTITDRDGDSSTATVSLTLKPDSVPQVVNVTAAVDDDGLNGATGVGNPANGGNDITSTTGSNPPSSSEAIFNGQITVGFGADTPGSLSFANLNNTTGQVGTETVTYTWNAGVLTATGPRGALFTVSLTPSGAYTVTLLDNVLHAVGGNDETSAPVVDLNYRATDSDGSVSEAGKLSITFNDDMPSAVNDGITQATENQAVTIDVLANDVAGADGIQTVALVAGSQVGVGTLIHNGGGSFTLTPATGQEGTVTFQYTITDGDGDVRTATATITLLADSVPVPTNATASVDDDGLTDGNALSTTGDIAAGTAGETAFAGQISVDFGGDTGTVSFANLDGTTGAVGTETVTYAWNALTTTLTATGPRGALFTVELTPSGAYTVTLLDNVLHAAGGGETSAPIVDLAYRAADSDGDSVTTGKLSITFNDDAPTASDNANNVTEGLGHAVTGNVAIDDALGADGAATGGAVTAARVGTELGGGALSSVGAAGTTISGTWGDLLIKSDGTYTYTLKTASIPVGTTSETFTYQVTDGDGDTDLAQLVIALDQDTQTPDVGGLTPTPVTVLEDGLVDGTTSETATGTFTVDAHGENYTLTLTGNAGPVTIVAIGDTVTTDKGVLTITDIGAPVGGVVTYGFSYTLSQAQAHTGQGTINPLTDTITTAVTDATGDSDPTPGSIVISIVDDVPVALDNTNAVTEGLGNSTLGDVYTNDTIGADGAAVGGAVTGARAGTEAGGGALSTVTAAGTTISGTWGDLLIKSDGTYTYTLKTPAIPEGSPSETFTYQITDGDGDTDLAQLVISLNQDTNFPAVGSLVAATVYEDGLADGAQHDTTSETGTGTFTVDANGESYALTLNGTPISQIGDTVTTAKGVLIITGISTPVSNVVTYSYSYTLTAPLTHTGQGEINPLTDTVAMQVTDATGDSDPTPGSIVISIVDDAAVAVADTGSVTEGATLPVLAASGVLANDVAGADGYAIGGGVVGVRAAGGDTTTAVQTNVGIEITGAYGKLTLNADGSYTYKANPNAVTVNAVDHFVYTIKDGDGDLSTTTLAIAVNNVTLTGQTVTQTVDEAALDTTQTGSDLGVSTVTGSTGTSSAAETVTGTLSNAAAASNGYVAQSVTTANGKFVLNTDGTYTYTLISPVASGAVAGANTVAGVESFTYTFADANGNTGSGSIKIDVKDDVPTAAADAAMTVLETDGVTSGTNLLANDVKGADGATVTAVSFDGGTNWTTVAASGTTTVTPAGGQGTYTFQAGGAWTFDPSVDASASNQTGHFTYRITDGDGDTSTATQTVNITNVDSPLLLIGSGDGDSTGTPTDHTLPNPGGSVDGPLVGGGLDDKIVGDPGAVTITPGQSANVVLVLDSSGSMDADIGGGVTRIQALKDGVNGLIDNLAASGGYNVRVTVIDFDSSATNRGTFNLIVNGVVNNAEVTAAHTAVGLLNDEGGTNYEAGLQSAYDWINGGLGLAGAQVNKVVFVSDGEPNEWNGSPGFSFDSTAEAMAQILGTSAGNDSTNEPLMIIGKGYSIDAIGIDISGAGLNYLGDVEDGVAGGTSGAQNVTTAAQLATSLSVLGGSTALAAAGNDTINGNGGNDIIFGDVLYTDTPASTHAVSAPAGSGFSVFQTLENRATNPEASDPAGNGGDWTRADTMAYIAANHLALSQESGRAGGNDTIHGGDGNDIIYGQEGNDTITAGIGDDTISGGTGADQLSGGAGDDTFLFKTGDVVAGETIQGGADTDTIKVLTSTDFTNLGATATLAAASIEQILITSGQAATFTGAQLTGQAINVNATAAGAATLNVNVNGTATLAGLSFTPFGSNDAFTSGTDVINITGGTNADTITGTSLADSIVGGAGNDTIIGAENDTLLDGGADTDTLQISANFTSASNNQIQNIENFTLTTAVSVNLSNQNENLTILGSSGNDTIRGGAGADVIDGGGGSDTLIGGVGVDTFNATTGTSTISDLGASGLADIVKVSVGAIANATTTGAWTATAATTNSGTASISTSGIAVNLTLAGGTSGWTLTNTGLAATLTGSANADTIIGAAGADTLTGGGGADTLTGGNNADTFNVNSGTDTITDLGTGGTDILVVSAGATAQATVTANWTASGATTNGGTASVNANGFIVNLDNAGGASGWTLTNSSATGVSLTGSNNNDTITGGTGGDTINGGTGADTLGGSAGTDIFNFAGGDSTLAIGGSGNAGTISGYDVISDFQPTSSERIGFSGAAIVANATVNGNNSSLTIGGNQISSHQISGGIIAFDDTGTFTTALSLTTTAHIAAVVEYLQAQDFGNAGTTVAFEAVLGGVNHTYVFIQGANNGANASDVLIDLVGVNASGITAASNQIAVAGTTTVTPPIVLDLDDDGAEFLSLSAGVTFDYNGNGHTEATAWAGADDGILSIDLNGDGKITSAAEFVFGGNGLTDLQGLALQYDSNHDRMLDALDASFAKFGVWRDANSNGVADAGEFKSLGELGIASVNLTSDGQVYTAADGDVIVHGTTTYTRADGTTGTGADASFATEADRQARTAELASTAAAASGVVAAAIVAASEAPEAEAATAPAANDDTAPAASVAPDAPPAPAEGPAHADALLGQAPSQSLAPQHQDSQGEAESKPTTSLTTAAEHAPAPAPAADQAGGHNGPAHTSAFDFGGHDGHLMDALLAANLPAPQGPTVAPAAVQDAVSEALGDTAATQTVDAVIDHFAANGTEPGAAPAGPTPAADPAALAGLLLAHVGPGADAHAFVPLPAVDHHDAALIAAA